MWESGDEEEVDPSTKNWAVRSKLPLFGAASMLRRRHTSGVDVHGEDGGGFNSLEEVGSPREEDGFHGLELVAVAVISG